MNITEFRKDLKKHFDTAITESVYITRGGIIFELTAVAKDLKMVAIGIDPEKINRLSDAKISTKPQPNVMNVITDEVVKPVLIGTNPDTTNEFVDAKVAGNRVVPKCCKLKNPCKHWQFDGEYWVNSITGEKKEVT